MSKAPQIFSWFIRQVEKGLAQIKRGELLEHDEVTARMDRPITQKHPRDSRHSSPEPSENAKGEMTVDPSSMKVPPRFLHHITHDKPDDDGK
jgi:hypothetical protein